MANESKHVSSAGLALVRFNEGDRAHAYNDIANNCTIGTGMLLHSGPCTASDLQMPTSATGNEQDFQARLRDAERKVRTAARTRELTQSQYDAAVSFAYNLGGEAVKSALAPFESGNTAGTAEKIMLYTKYREHGSHGQVTGPWKMSHGLKLRRERESAPFRAGGQ